MKGKNSSKALPSRSSEVCSLDVTFDITCYSHKNLKLIAKAYNRTHVLKGRQRSEGGVLNRERSEGGVLKRQRSEDSIIKNIETLSKKELWEALNSKIKDCEHEQCWLKYIKKVNNKDLEKISDETFKVDDPNDELMTDIINRVMRQCERKYKNFTFLNALPSDAYDDKVLRAYSPVKGRKNMKKDKIGIVFNTDPHFKDGQHWLGIFIDNDKKVAEYFDSLGEKPITDVIMFIKKYYPTFVLKYNKIQHQPFNNNECGVYAMEFIDRRLKGETFEKITNSFMKIDRKKYFK